MLLEKINRIKLKSMRLNKLFILYSLFGILMASCIKDEAPNAEADITGISFEEDVLANSYIDPEPVVRRKPEPPTQYESV